MGFFVVVFVMGVKQQREYKEAVDAFNEKNLEKIQLITKLMEVSFLLLSKLLIPRFEYFCVHGVYVLTEEIGQLAGESENLRLKKLEDLSKSI